MSASSLPVAVWFWEASGRVGPMSVCRTLASRLIALSVSGVGAPRLATTLDCLALAPKYLATVWYWEASGRVGPMSVCRTLA